MLLLVAVLLLLWLPNGSCQGHLRLILRFFVVSESFETSFVYVVVLLGMLCISFRQVSIQPLLAFVFDLVSQVALLVYRHLWVIFG